MTDYERNLFVILVVCHSSEHSLQALVSVGRRALSHLTVSESDRSGTRLSGWPGRKRIAANTGVNPQPGRAAHRRYDELVKASRPSRAGRRGLPTRSHRWIETQVVTAAPPIADADLRVARCSDEMMFDAIPPTISPTEMATIAIRPSGSGERIDDQAGSRDRNSSWLKRPAVTGATR
jgi:hypothetical protein